MGRGREMEKEQPNAPSLEDFGGQIAAGQGGSGLSRKEQVSGKARASCGTKDLEPAHGFF